MAPERWQCCVLRWEAPCLPPARLWFSVFPKKAQSGRLLESREQDQLNHSHRYSALATLCSAPVLVLVQGDEPSGKYLSFSSLLFLSPPESFNAQSSFGLEGQQAIPQSCCPRAFALELSHIPTPWYPVYFSCFLQVPSPARAADTSCQKDVIVVLLAYAKEIPGITEE